MAAQVFKESDEMKTAMFCAASDWEDDLKHCSICGDRIGKRVLKPRHHCRVCGRCVCASCTPNSLQQKGKQHRVCNCCINSIENGTRFQDALVRIGDNLSSLARYSPDPVSETNTGTSSNERHIDEQTTQISEPMSRTRKGSEASTRASSGMNVLSEVSALSQESTPDGDDAVKYCTSALKKVREKLVDVEARATTAEAAVEYMMQNSNPDLQACSKLEWEPNATECRRCNRRFSVRLWTHHCRLCGRCVCEECSPHRVELVGKRGLHRACRDCVARGNLVEWRCEYSA